MGLEITRATHGRRDLRIGTALERAGSTFIGKDVGELAGLKALGVTISDDFDQCFKAVDVAIDLSSPDATEKVVRTALKHKVPLVCGTTGLENAAQKALENAAGDIPVLYTPNLSLGIAVTKMLVEQAVRTIGPDWDVEIVEMHHREKVDSPSGTAMALAAAVAECKKVSLEDAGRFGRHGKTGKRGASEIGIHALRGGGVFGWHKVILAGKHETIEICHRASTRALFAEGALMTALFLQNKAAGLYTMNDVLAESIAK
jgi:4-hydroxy-tetrahydrodipicolinate reductase